MDSDDEFDESMVDIQMSIEENVRCLFLTYFIGEECIFFIPRNFRIRKNTIWRR